MGWGFYWEDGELEKNMACHDGFVIGILIGVNGGSVGSMFAKLEVYRNNQLNPLRYQMGISG